MSSAVQYLARALHSPLVLASASPRRQEILQLAGIPFETATSDAEAELDDIRNPHLCAAAGARAKAQDVARRFSGRLVLGADTVVALDGRPLGKPQDANEALTMLQSLNGRCHEVITAYCLTCAPTAEVVDFGEDVSTVRFKQVDADILARYVAGGDPLDKAGAYGIQSSGGKLVEEVIGSYLNVVGFPLAKVLSGLAKAGWAPRRE